MDLKINERVYFISGGSKGIGKSLIQFLLNEGARVATCARNEEGLIALRNSVSSDKIGNLLTFRCDVLDTKEMEKTMASVVNEFGQIDGIVANAGFGTTGNVLETTKDVWTSQYEMKLFSILNVVQPAINDLKKSEAGRIVIMNGVTANKPDAHMAAVSAARAAVKKVAYLLAESLSPSILVNCINIGAITTDRQLDRYKKSKTGLSFADWEQTEAKRRGIMLGRYGRTEEVVPFISLLLSPLSSYITASCIDISGGLDVM